MLKIKVLAIILALQSSLLIAQGVRYDNRSETVQTNMPAGANAPVLAIPSAKVLICTDSACATAASIYQDQGMTVAAANPLTASTAGLWGFWAASGTYYYKITTTQGVVTGPFPVTLGGSGGGGGGATFPGANGIVFNTSSTTARNAVLGDLTALGAAPAASPSLSNANLTGSTIFSSISGSNQCLHVNSVGILSGTGSDCSAGGGALFPGTNGIVVNTSTTAARTGILSDLTSLGAATSASPSFTGTVTLPVTGSTQCIHVNAAGAVSGTGVDCGSGGGGMTQLTGDVTAGPGSGSQAATLANTAVAAGSYTNANITVDAKGRLTSASNGSSGAGTVTTTGSPANGNLTRFAGATSITNTDLTGAVTTSGGVATTLANSAVATANIANSAVTLGKIQNAAANSKLIGSGSAGVGASYSELTIAGTLSMSGTTLSAGTGLVASGTTALGTSAIASATCATVVTATATGTATTDAIIWNPNASIKAVTGYVPATTGGLSIAAYPTTNAINFDVCNWTSASITPGAVSINWVVTR